MLAQILLPELNEFVLYQEVVFGTAANVLQPDDVETIQKLALPRIFFPVEDDFDDEVKKLPWYVMHALVEKPTENSFHAWPHEYRPHLTPVILMLLWPTEGRSSWSC